MKLILTALLVISFSACSLHHDPTNTPTVAADRTTEKNKELVKRVYAEMVNKQNYELIDSFFAPDIFDHGALEDQKQGRKGFKKAVSEFLEMFSKLEVKVEEVLADGDMIASRETWNVTIASSNKTLSGETMHFFRIKDGLITDEWSKGWEWLGM